jgi:hypothetical protein
MSNIFKTTLLLTGMTLLLMLAGRAFGGQNGMLMALAFAAVMPSRSAAMICRAFTTSSSAWRKKSACRCPRST